MSEKIENPSVPVGFKVKAFDSAGTSRMVVMDKGNLEMEPVQIQVGENVDAVNFFSRSGPGSPHTKYSPHTRLPVTEREKFVMGKLFKCLIFVVFIRK